MVFVVCTGELIKVKLLQATEKFSGEVTFTRGPGAPFESPEDDVVDAEDVRRIR